MTLRDYVNRRGQQARLAETLMVSPVLIHQWATDKRPIPVSRCVEIELATAGAVTRQELRPHDWRVIWPELVKFSGAGT